MVFPPPRFARCARAHKPCETFPFPSLAGALVIYVLLWCAQNWAHVPHKAITKIHSKMSKSTVLVSLKSWWLQCSGQVWRWTFGESVKSSVGNNLLHRSVHCFLFSLWHDTTETPYFSCGYQSLSLVITGAGLLIHTWYNNAPVTPCNVLIHGRVYKMI